MGKGGLNQLRRNRELRAAGSKIDSGYADADDDDDAIMYDEMTTDEFRKYQREQLQQDDFVEDDDGKGYADNGEGDFDGDHKYYSDDEEEVQEKPKYGNLKSMFSKAAASAPTKPKQKPKPKATSLKVSFGDTSLCIMVNTNKTVDDGEDFLASIMSKYDNKLADLPKKRKADKMVAPMTAKKREAPIPNTNPAPSLDSVPVPAIENKENKNITDIAESETDVFDDTNIPFSDDYTPLGHTTATSQTKVFPAVSSPLSSVVAASSPDTSQLSSSQPSAETWFDIGNQLKESINQTEASAANLDREDLDLVQDGNEQSALVFWTDYEEVRNTLILFGKTKLKNSDRYVSCCVQTDQVLRPLYVLPREGFTMKDVFSEISSILDQRKVQVEAAKECRRKYCFEAKNVPRQETAYLRVMVSFTAQIEDIESGDSFSHVFGHSTQMFEQFTLAKKIWGPCWLKIRNGNFAHNSSTSCKVSIKVDDLDDVSVIKDSEAPILAPPLTAMAVSIRTKMNAERTKQELVAISCRVYENLPHDTTERADRVPNIVFTAIRPIEKVWPMGFSAKVEEYNTNNANKISLQTSEQSLLNFVLAKIQRYDPDILLGHELENIHLNIILQRLRDLKVNSWHKVSRLKRPQLEPRFIKKMCNGRLLCDLNNPMGRSMTTKCASWSLTEMAKLYLEVDRFDIEPDAAKCTLTQDAAGLMKYIEYNELDTGLAAAIAFRIQILALSKQLTNLAGNSWAKTLAGSRVDRNNFLLLHEFCQQKFIAPDYKRKNNLKDDASSNKAKFQGGLVLEPEKGLYKNLILVMDFNSLYPSIIQEYNICFTTVDLSTASEGKLPEYPEGVQQMGLFPRIIETLVTRRREVKKNMKSLGATQEQMAQWDIKQQALKLTANSMYGCLGFSESRFYAKPLAEMTTFKGREALLSTKMLAEGAGLQVVYGDTDSVMINTSTVQYDEALVIGNDFKKKVNERYRKLEIDIDNVFAALLLTAKKKYAAMVVSKNKKTGELDKALEVKGLDLRRREYCILSKEASEFALRQLLEQPSADTALENIHEFLRTFSQEMRDNKFALHKYCIRKKLGKDPAQYTEAKPPPHVVVALRLRHQGKVVKADDVMQYIVCQQPGTSTDGATEPASIDEVAQRCFTMPEVNTQKLLPDVEWYLISQLFPPLERVCEYVPGTDRMKLAECMGLDSTKYKIHERQSAGLNPETGIQPLESLLTDEERFSESRKLLLTCLNCQHRFEFVGLMGKLSSTLESDGIHCPECQDPIRQTSVNAQLETAIRKEIYQYYTGWLVCKDPACGTHTRQISVYGKKCVNFENQCFSTMRYEYTDKELYTQLLYFDSLFNSDKAKSLLETARKEKDSVAIVQAEKMVVLCSQNAGRFTAARKVVNKYLSNCGYRYVNMRDIFDG